MQEDRRVTRFWHCNFRLYLHFCVFVSQLSATMEASIPDYLRVSDFFICLKYNVSIETDAFFLSFSFCLCACMCVCMCLGITWASDYLVWHENPNQILRTCKVGSSISRFLELIFQRYPTSVSDPWCGPLFLSSWSLNWIILERKLLIKGKPEGNTIPHLLLYTLAA